MGKKKYSPVDGVFKVPTKHDWSIYQKKIFKELSDLKNDLVIAAYAGTAKTTSLVEAMKYVPATKKVLIVAFNKSIQEDLDKKINRINVENRTLHSLGARSIAQSFGKTILDNQKSEKIIEELYGKRDYEVISNVAKTVSFCKASLNDTPSHIKYLIDSFDIDLCGLQEKEFISLVIKTLSKSKEMKNIINYDDMCWFPYIHNLSVGQFDIVAVDEFQDLNYSQIIMAKKALKPDGKLIFAGDFYQSLYSWRLADTTFVRNLLKKPETKLLSLPISYRCPKAIIELAQQMVPNITCPSSAIDGEIIEISQHDMLNKIKPGEVLLSRYNAPLIKLAMKFLRSGIRCNIMGRDIGDGLLTLIKKSGKDNLPDLSKWLAKWLQDKVDDLKSKNINPENTIDRVECLNNLIEEASSIDDLKKSISELFDDTDKTNIILLSSIHRFKGKECDTIYVLKYTLRYWPNPELDDSDLESEERNITYVAITRTKNKLYLVNK